jgi:cytochrome oxidase Cu insertion factor (SCO1/SenC/PrrC family)/thiol-disulfide isomerase/thioredoxin
MKRLTLLVLALLALAAPAVAQADGDPGSDELVFQNLFFGADDGISTAQQVQLGKLLTATEALRAPVRVAIIGKRDDLGTVTPAFGDPAYYAYYLGTELELSYSGRLLVVMPQGVATFWFQHDRGTALDIPSGSSSSQLVNAAITGVRKLEAAAGISAGTLDRAAGSAGTTAAAVAVAHESSSAAIASSAAPIGGTEPKASASATNVSPVIIVLGLVVILGAVFWAPPLWRRRAVLRAGGIALPGLAVGLTALGALVVLAVVIHSSNASFANDTALATNPDLGGVSSLGDSRTAPNFALTDETGHQISLKQYRGKVVLLSFTDDECQTICPLTTQAMVDARDSLGAAAKDVQLLGVNANPRSTSIDDVLSYTQVHGMLNQWHFLTGSLGKLETIWQRYGVADDVGTDTDLIDHTPALYIIGPDGKMRASSLTQSNYAAIPQYGQELAQEISRVLPSHPKVQTHYSYSTIKGISPTTRIVLPTVGGGQVTLGTGKPHLYLFFATWDAQSTSIKAHLKLLNTYARAAKRLGLPPITAIDEGAVEPNPSAVRTFLAGTHLDYPVAIDRTGQVADGYGVQGEPWFVLGVPNARNTAADPTADTPFAQEVYTQGWPSIATLEKSIPAALKPAKVAGGAQAIAKELNGSPPVLVALHRQSGRLLGGGARALVKRLAGLKGEPVVVNVWASDCIPCQQEFNFFATESAAYGAKVAFVGVDYEDTSRSAAVGFLARHHVSYPSYSVAAGNLPSSILPGGIEGTPTTIIFNAKGGKPTWVQIGSYTSAQQLGEQIQTYALG